MLTRKAIQKLSIVAVLLALTVVPVTYANDALNQGLSHFKSGKYAEAAAEFQSLVDGSPSYDYGYFMLGLSLLKMGKFDEAQRNIEEAIKLNGDKFEYHNGLASVFYTKKDYPKAVASLKTAEPLASADAQKFALYWIRGSCYASMGKWPDAVDDLEKARKINSQKPAVLVALGQAYFKLGYFDKAIPVFRQVVKLTPSDTDSVQLLADALINQGAESTSDSQKDSMYKEALGYAEMFQKAEPANYEASNLVGRAALGSTDYVRAEQAFKKVLAQNSDYCYAMVNLGKTYIALERWKDAEEILNDAATCAPRMAVVYESLGFAVQKQGRLQDAINAYEKAYEIKPSESVRTAIDICKQNIEVQQFNKDVAKEEQAQTEAEKQAQAEYEAELQKQKEWEERRKKDR